ncbi:hypothetical protein V5799_001267 [Amblyomma americanum]|uniref:Uncharacterized protein n=1 Tax=Amblyomma americanum TaxID=6943 RepID=A0AAQ4D0N8_AMBAM
MSWMNFATVHGGTASMWHADNPFVLIVQLSFGLLLHAGDGDTALAGVTRTAQGLIATQCRVLDSPPYSSCELHRQFWKEACSELLARDLRSAPLLFTAIKGLSWMNLATGHGGTASLRHADNPFVLIEQPSFGLLLDAGDGDTAQAVVTRTAQGLTATQCHVLDSPPYSSFELHREHRKEACSELLARDLRSAALLSTAIKGLSSVNLPTGHGCSASIRHADNRFVLIVQLSFSLLLHAGDGDTAQAGVTRTAQGFIGTQCHVLDSPPYSSWELHRQHRKEGCSELWHVICVQRHCSQPL